MPTANRDMLQTMHNEILQVIEIVRRITDGSTQPFLCRCNDDELYVVKGMPRMTKKELMAELISACLAQEFSLSLPEFKIVYVDQGLTEFTPDWEGELQEGYAFATRFISGVAPITFSQAHSNVDVITQKKIYLFDKWINNSDRTLSPQGGNVNMIFDYQNNRYYLIDHNLAFDHDVQGGEFDYHVYSNRHRSWNFDLVDRQVCEDDLSRILALLPQTINSIPEEWELEIPEDNETFLNFVRSTLSRSQDGVFWSNIT